MVKQFVVRLSFIGFHNANQIRLSTCYKQMEHSTNKPNANNLRRNVILHDWVKENVESKPKYATQYDRLNINIEYDLRIYDKQIELTQFQRITIFG